MSRLARLIVIGLVTMLSLVPFAPPAHAAGDPEAARKAAAWVAGRADSLTSVGEAADAALALAAARDAEGNPAHPEQADALLALLERDGAAAVADSPESAAKLAIVAAAYGRDPRAFVPGTDLVALVTGGVAEDGSFGAWPGPFASGLAAVALDRAGEQVPDSLVTHLLTYANSDGGFGPVAGEASDADSTGMALLGLVNAESAEARDAVDGARRWAEQNQAGDGSWAGYNPVNSTAVLGGALASSDGSDQADAVAYLTGVQAPSGAFQNSGTDDLMATTQAALLLGGVSYLDVAVPEPAAADSLPAPANQADVPAANDAASPVPWLAGGGVLVLALVVGWALLRRSRAAR